MDSAIKLGQDRAKTSPIGQTLVSLAGAAGSRLIPPRSCPTDRVHLSILTEQVTVTEHSHETRPNYEHERQEPGVIAPGVYAVEPAVSHWEAPGPILKDEQILVAPRQTSKLSNETGEKIVRPAPQGSYPNPGWPLPGHVMTNPATGPGTRIWKDAGLDWYDW